MKNNKNTQNNLNIMFATGIGTGSTITAEFDNVAVYNSVNPILKNYATDVGSGDSLGTAADGIDVLTTLKPRAKNDLEFLGECGFGITPDGVRPKLRRIL